MIDYESFYRSAYNLPTRKYKRLNRLTLPHLLHTEHGNISIELRIRVKYQKIGR